MKKICFLSNGCQGSLCNPREIITADPDYCETMDPRRADILMVNFCAISAESIGEFESFRNQIIRYKKSNPNLKILAGGCIEGLPEKKDLSFADAIFHHQEEATALATLLGKDTHPALAPTIMNGAVTINIAQGCNRRCSFCKVHYLDHMHLISRPIEEILDLAQQALAQGINTVVLSAENSTEYGTDLGTNLQTLLKQLLALNDLRILDIYGLCLDEITPNLLQMLKHPKTRTLQLEVQSLDDQIRKNMGLHKTKDEAIAILNTLSNKFLISNFMIGFPGHSLAEFNREMRQIRAHHLYFLSLDDYDDTPGVPSHKLYQPLEKSTAAHYRETFLHTVAEERQLLLELLMRQPSIEASVVSSDRKRVRLYASHYTITIHAEQPRHYYRPGNIVHVKITGLHSTIPPLLKFGMRKSTSKNNQTKQLLQDMEYFDIISKDQIMQVNGEIIDSVP